MLMPMVMMLMLMPPRMLPFCENEDDGDYADDDAGDDDDADADGPSKTPRTEKSPPRTNAEQLKDRKEC